MYLVYAGGGAHMALLARGLAGLDLMAAEGAHPRRTALHVAADAGNAEVCIHSPPPPAPSPPLLSPTLAPTVRSHARSPIPYASSPTLAPTVRSHARSPIPYASSPFPYARSYGTLTRAERQMVECQPPPPPSPSPVLIGHAASLTPY